MQTSLQEKLTKLPNLKFKSRAKLISLEVHLTPNFDDHGNGEIKLEYKLSTKLLPFSGSGLFINSYTYNEDSLKLTQHTHIHKNKEKKKVNLEEELNKNSLDFIILAYANYLFSGLGDIIFEPINKKQYFLSFQASGKEIKAIDTKSKAEAVFDPFIETLSVKIKLVGEVTLQRYGHNFTFRN